MLTSPNVVTNAASFESLKDLCCRAFRNMVRARVLEDKLASLYRAGGRIVGGVYLGRGQETFSASLAVHLTRGRDVYGGLIRDQAGKLVFGEPMLDCTRTYLGSAFGPTRGRDGNVHRGRPREGTPVMISHLGSLISVVAGMLLSRRLQGKLGDCIGATCIGDGGTSTGSFHEGINMAAVEKLPLVLSVANNLYAYSTPNNRSFACEHLVDKAKGYGIEGYSVDGADLPTCVEVFQNAVNRARAGHGPQMVVGTFLRLSGHGEHDDASYVPDSVKCSVQARDCMVLAEKSLLEREWFTKSEIQEIYDEAKDECDKAIAKSSSEVQPDPYKESWNALATPMLAEE